MSRRKRRRPDDKIFDNSFNKGEIQYEQVEDIEVNNDFVNDFMFSFKKPLEYEREKQLNLVLYDLWENDKWFKIYKKRRRIAKDDLAEIYAFFKSKIKDTTYSDVEIFINIAEFLSVNYKILYETIPTKFKRQLLVELHEKYPQYINKHKECKLF